MGSTGADGLAYGAYTYEDLEREPYWPSEKVRICVTGAGGFIASHIARRLKSEGHYIIASDSKKNEHMTEDMFCHEFHLVDLEDMDNCVLVTKGVDHVFNLPVDMGGMGFIQSNYSAIIHNNLMISCNMLAAAKANGVKRFFYASSACVDPKFKQLETNVSLKESDAWPAEVLSGIEEMYQVTTRDLHQAFREMVISGIEELHQVTTRDLHHAFHETSKRSHLLGEGCLMGSDLYNAQKETLS